MADEVGVPIECVLKQAVAQNNGSRSSGRVFTGGKAATEHGVKAKDIKVRGGYSLTMHILSPPGPLEVDTASVAGNGRGYGRNIVAQLAPGIAIDIDRITTIRRAGDSLHQGSQALRFRIRKRPQKQRVHHTENRGVRADAQCQGEDDDKREAGVLRQLLQCVT